MADYEDLCEALEAYDVPRGERNYEALKRAADACGRGRFDPPLSWSRRRVSTYRTLTTERTMSPEALDGSVGYLNNIIEREMSK